jgi:hypothetical protein
MKSWTILPMTPTTTAPQRGVLASFAFLLISMMVSGQAAAQGSSGFSTFQISWSAAAVAPTAVPTMSTFGTAFLAVLLALVVYRVSRNRGLLVRAIAPLATLGVIASFTIMSERPIAQPPAPSPAVEASSCSGSETYTADEAVPPPCLINTCGSAIVVSYTLVAGETPDGTPLTEESCTLDYYCDEVGDGEAAQGATISSNGLRLATAFCLEQFDDE